MCVYLQLGHNPITASFSSLILEAIKKNPHVALRSLDLEVKGHTYVTVITCHKSTVTCFVVDGYF